MEAQTKKVSVIIPVYNAEKYIRKTLDSVLAQSFRNREILLVENGCEDQSTEILREYKEKYDEIRLIHSAQNKKLFSDGAIKAALFITEQQPGFYTEKDLYNF